MTDRLHLVIVEDDPLYRTSLAEFLRLDADVNLLACFASATEALATLTACEGDLPPWQIVLMDIDLPGIRGTEATRLLKRHIPNLLVVVLTVFEEPIVILDAIAAGADGYLLKRTPPAEILAQLRVVANGGAPLTAGIAKIVLDLVRSPGRPHSAIELATGGDPLLSDRELDVLRGLVDGLAYKQVADRLGISIDTVRTHVRGLYKKLHVHSVGEAVSRALRDRLL
jgi:DNA-binding NarL/FixJ family response regulator